MVANPRLRVRLGMGIVLLAGFLIPVGCGGGGGGGAAAVVVQPPPPPAAPNNAPLFQTALTVAPTALGSGGGIVNFNVQVADPDSDPLTVAVSLANASTGQLQGGTRLALQNGVFTGSLSLAPNGTSVNITFNVFVEATDQKVAVPTRQNGPSITIQGLVGPPPAPSLSPVNR